jgi:hypothetical protein
MCPDRRRFYITLSVALAGVLSLRVFQRAGAQRVGRHRDELPPGALPWDLVQKLLRSVDLKSKTGWRDYMVLHFMAYDGLRA